MAVERACGDDRRVSPHRLQELVLAKYPPWLAGEVKQQLVLKAGQLQMIAVEAGRILACIDRERSEQAAISRTP